MDLMVMVMVMSIVTLAHRSETLAIAKS